MAEFALILPIALLVLFGIIQFGFLFASQIGFVNALRETVRYGSTSPVNDATSAGITKGNICTHLSTVALEAMPGYEPGFLGPSSVSFETYTDPHGGTPTYSVRLTVYAEYRHRLLVPLVNAILDGVDGTTDGRFRLAATEAMRVENPILTTNPALSYSATC